MQFYKYQGTGNDFVMVDNFNHQHNLSIELIQKLCDRRFGIGADGLISIEQDSNADFYINYFNADGSQSFCGNGARCAVRFANDLGLISDKTKFNAIDGLHEAKIESDLVSIKMNDVSEIEKLDENTFVLDTGSPHYVKFVNDLEEENIFDFGKEIRYSNRFKEDGINVNLAQINSSDVSMLTYERGVEDETYSCGTGATAVALAKAKLTEETSGITPIKVKGGNLQIKFQFSEGTFSNIWLSGPAIKVFQGIWI